MKNTIFFLALIITHLSILTFCTTQDKKDENLKDTLNVVAPGDIVSITDTSYTPPYEAAILENDSFLSFRVNPKKQNLKLYYKDEKGDALGSIENLKKWVESKGQKLVFAMNGGMYMEGGRPLGLYIENYQTISPINKRLHPGANFYSKPNGVFYIDSNNVAAICKTENFVNSGNIKYATQSGPMILFDGEIHPACKKNSPYTAVRNGVGILPGNEVLFVLTATDVSFYQFMNYFKSSGCKDALFFDGNVSLAYLPEKNWINDGGAFGVMVGVTE
jgi:uncharacterized protein YigE (DUF2233 family)